MGEYAGKRLVDFWMLWFDALGPDEQGTEVNGQGADLVRALSRVMGM